MLKIFGLNINFVDFFTQIGHCLTIALGAGIASGIITPQAGQVVQDATAVVNQTVQNVHQTGVIGALISLVGTIALMAHNSTAAPINPPNVR